MKIIQVGALSTVLVLLAGCSTLGEPPKFVPSDPEAMTEWQVEGSVKVKGEAGKEEAFITYKQVNGEYELQVRQDKPVGEPVAVVKGIEGEGAASEQITAKNPQAEKLAQSLQSTLPLNNMSYWLRALPATENAKVSKEEDELAANEIKDDGWKIQYNNYMQVNSYLLPDQIEMQKDDTSVEIELVRADTGFLASPCENFTPNKEGDNANKVSGNPMELLLPRDGSAPKSRWIDENAFCSQLYKVHGKIPDPRIGLFGPDSMYWKLLAPAAPAGMGAGRALLLQTAHPWVTAGIDEHSIVRYDPMERFRRTFSNINTMVYGSMPQVMSAAHFVRSMHNEVKGTINYHAGAFKPGSNYGANEISAMIWVHATLWETTVHMYEEVVEPLTQEEKDRFYEETKLFAMLFGIPESALPRNWNEFMAYAEAMWYSPQLTVTDNARKLKEDLFTSRSIWLTFPLWIQETVTAVNLPAPVREGYGMDDGLWERFNYSWLMGSAEFANWILPDYLAVNPVHYEAMARLQGKRNDYYHSQQLKVILGNDRLVN
ncbi:MAG TPA: lipoprotein insertase outer membrane protein LolB [Dongiaceae bacterium]|nr:lipoprotein insertase outer membrane protein LolB [Dongiaceae bacterium]